MTSEGDDRDPSDQLSPDPANKDVAPSAGAEPDATIGAVDNVHRHLPFPVVGVGSSAGGLEAVSELLRALPTDTGMAFVLVPHLSPTHDSVMAEILARTTAMAVVQVHDEPEVQPNHVYVIPPGRSMVIEGGKLRLFPRPKRSSPHRAVDQFLHSLALDQTYTAIGVILSGTGTDGSVGIQEIKENGGITFAQDGTAQHDGMPRAAMSTSCVDFVLPPAGIAAELARIARHPYVVRGGDRALLAMLDRVNISRILQLLHDGTGVDFTHYKHMTLYRRISRRMLLHRLDALADYVTLLQENPGEVDALYHDILINVTSFFRNADAFAALRDTVFPRFIAEHPREQPVRVWVLGCSTGEEAYSLAIALSEFAEEKNRSLSMQIFATDLNARGIERARSGLYPRTIAEDVSPERLRRYFVEVDGHYRVTKAIRDMCVFARHNGVVDPPFSHIDLISCRNMLIYLDQVLQQRLIPVLHYALRPEGHLWLGSSETVGGFRDLFDVEDARNKIYSKKSLPGRPRQQVPILARAATPVRAQAPGRPARELPAIDTHREADRILLNRYTPPSVLVNSDLDILQFRGDTGMYLAPAPGKASLNLLKMLREGLLVAVRSAITRARVRDAGVIREENLRVRTDSGIKAVHLEIVPVRGAVPRDDCFLVLFEDPDGQPRYREPDPLHTAMVNDDTSQEERVKQELRATREYLQAVIEQQEAAYEQLQSANEEVQSANEELQSINEELETSKEEIQSSNEELATVNDELHTRNVELGQSNNDLLNLLSSVQLAIVMLGPDLRIRRFTPAAERMLNLIAGDVGRPITDITLNVAVDDLEALLLQVMQSMDQVERIGQDRSGRWYSLRIRPYRTLENRIEGAVIVLVDIDTVKRAEAAIAESEARFRLMADNAPVLIWMHNTAGVEFVNRAWLEFLGVPEDEVLGDGWERFIHPDDRIHFARLFASALRSGVPVDSQVRLLRHDGEYRWMKSVGLPRVALGDDRASCIGSMVDITDLKQSEALLREADRSKNDFIGVLAHELRNPLAPIRNVVQLLERSPDEATVAWARNVLARQTTSITRMVDDLLDVTRIAHGKIELRREVVDLVDVLERVLEMHEPTIRDRGQQLEIELVEPTAPVHGDPVRLQQVFGNLLNNASKFAARDGRVSLRLQVVEDPAPGSILGPMVEVRVSDDGIGIEPDLLPQIFEPFTQGDRGVNRAQGGLGIGLALVRRLVELHGGSVQAQSEGPGHGAEFVVRLPLSSNTPPMEGAAVPTERASTPQTPRRVLLIDDNADAAQALALLLRTGGHVVEVLTQGDAAVQAASAFYPDVVMVDIGLPGKDGYQVAQELRTSPAGAGALLIAVTGYSGDEDRARSLAAGFDRHCIKPVDIEVLWSLLAADCAGHN